MAPGRGEACPAGQDAKCMKSFLCPLSVIWKECKERCDFIFQKFGQETPMLR